MKPSEVVMGVPPLAATFGKAEAEWAAACIVRACQFHGDTWQPISAPQISEAIHSDIEAKREPFASLMRNPFFSPDVWKLIELGFARWVDREGGSAELLPPAIEAIRSKWHRPGFTSRKEGT